MNKIILVEPMGNVCYKVTLEIDGKNYNGIVFLESNTTEEEDYEPIEGIDFEENKDE